MAEDEAVGWHDQLNGCEFERIPRDDEGQGAWRVAVHRAAKNQTLLSD